MWESGDLNRLETAEDGCRGEETHGMEAGSRIRSSRLLTPSRHPTAGAITVSSPLASCASYPTQQHHQHVQITNRLLLRTARWLRPHSWCPRRRVSRRPLCPRPPRGRSQSGRARAACQRKVRASWSLSHSMQTERPCAVYGSGSSRICRTSRS